MLPANQMEALRNLARKHAGEPVDWINIADARALTDLGLAERNREGWNITPAGLQAMMRMGERPTGETASPPTPIR